MSDYKNYPVYPEPPNPVSDEDNIDFKRYLSLFLSNWYWFAISLFIALTVAYGINRYSEKLYTVSSTILIKDVQGGGGLSVDESFMTGSDIFSNRQNLNNEMGVLKSFSLNKRVIDSLPEFRIVYIGVGRRNIVESRLYKRCPIQVVPEGINNQPHGLSVSIKLNSAEDYIIESIGDTKVDRPMKFGEKYTDYGFNFTILPRYPQYDGLNRKESNKYYFYFSSAENQANSYRSRLYLTPIDQKATLVTMSVTGSVPEQEVDYLNKLMELYINQGLEAKNQMADSTIMFIDRQLAVIQDSLRVAERRLQGFRLENKIFDLSSEGGYIHTRLQDYEKEKTTLVLQEQYFKYLKQYLLSKNETGDIISPYIMGIDDRTFSGLVIQFAELQKNRREMLVSISDNLPAIRLIDENIEETRKTLLENIDSGIENITTLLTDVNKRLAGVNSEVNRLPVLEAKLINIQREFDINNTVYTYLLEKRAEAGIARASNVSDNKIIDQAEVYNAAQIRPKRKENYLKSLIIGLIIPALFINLLYYFNNRIIDNRDVSRRTSVPIIGYISHNDVKEELPVLGNPGSALSESFRSIRTSLKYLIKDTNNPVIAITSTISSEGKTFISLNLSVITAMLGKKVLLIGLDLRRPRIHRLLGIDNNEGLSTYLSHNCEYEDVIKETSVKNLFYARSGPVPPNPAELIDDERMKFFIERAKQEFDYIIVDTPPVAVVTDTLILAKYVDVNLFIVRQRYSSKNTLDLIQELYHTEKLKNMGIVMNDISLSGYYGYGLRYGYYKGYGYTFGKSYYGQYSYGKYGYSDKEHGYYKS